MNRIVAIAAVGGAIAAIVLAGCSAETRDKVLPYFFDGFAKDGEVKNPPTRRVRRELLTEIAELKRGLDDARATVKALEAGAHVKKAGPPIENAKTWDEAASLLPKDTAASIDWVQAIKTGVVQPRSGIDPDTPRQAVLEMDVELSAARSKVFTVSYPHAPHTEWLACSNCHPAIFPLKRRAEPVDITMTKIRSGQYCGVCHGKVAFPVDGHCNRCHSRIPASATWRPAGTTSKPIEAARTWTEAAKLLPVAADGQPDWPKALADGVIAPRPGIDPKAEDESVLPLDVELTPADSPAMKAVFPHETHTAILSCPTCHTSIFQMAAGADPIDMGKIFAGEYCGRCHGKVAFPVATGCPRCHPVLAGK